MNPKLIAVFVALVCFSLPKLSAQPNPTKNYTEEIKKHNLGVLYTHDSIFTYEDRENKTLIRKMEVLGFCGPKYERIRFKILRMSKNPNNPLEYLMVVKTLWRDTVHTFKGKLVIKDAKIFTYCELPLFEKGYVQAELNLKEKTDSTEITIQGNIKSYFLLDDRGKFRYNTIGFQSEKFCNNQFKGTWNNILRKESLVCNFGDYKIPEAGDLDIGDGEFVLNTTYLPNGWMGYYQANKSFPDTPEFEEAWKKEFFPWWK
jgi:hypothetical protein